MEIIDIKRQISDIFDPLAGKLGLLRPSEHTHTHTNFSLAYAATSIGLELSVDLSDFFIYALLFKPTGNGLPTGYQDKTGARQKLYIQEALKELGINCQQETKKLQQLGGDYQNCTEMATILARLIEQHWSAISSNTNRWFR